MITQERVKELFHYEPEDGFFTRKITVKYNAIKGSRADRSRCGKMGYRRISIDGKVYLSHRIAWLYVHGYIPEHQIDHINRNPSDNSIRNLREVSGTCNAKNSKIPRDNISGVKGVHFNINRWVVQMRSGGKTYHLERFVDFFEAVCHRLAVEQCLGWEECDDETSACKYVNERLLHVFPRR